MMQLLLFVIKTFGFFGSPTQLGGGSSFSLTKEYLTYIGGRGVGRRREFFDFQRLKCKATWALFAPYR